MIIKKLITIAGTFLIMSCDSSMNADLRHYIKTIKLRQLSFKERVSLPAMFTEFNYSNNNQRRDPFKPMSDVKITFSEQNSSTQLLKKFPLTALKFVGLLKTSSISWALMQDPHGKVIHIARGDCISKDHLELIKIRKKMLSFEEKYFANGKWQKKIVNVHLNHRNRS